MKQEITKLFSLMEALLIATAILAGCLTMRASDREFGVPASSVPNWRQSVGTADCCRGAKRRSTYCHAVAWLSVGCP